MHNLRTLLTMFLFLLAAPLATLAGPAAPASGAVGGGARVRPNDHRAAVVFLTGIQRSDTFRALVDRLEQRNVIVYVRMDPTLKGKLAGRLTWMAATRNFRYVRISLNPEIGGDLAVATLGHELQHAVEVADAPAIVDAESLAAYYQKNGVRVGTRRDDWDSLAARTIGHEVRRELSQAPAARVVASIEPFDPRDWNIVYRRARGMLPP
jgi:hypothetical protein